jgi:desulfoferrodoxin (superoxide reductase-like protein)
MTKAKILFSALAFTVLALYSVPAFANKSAVTISAPASAAKGGEVTIKVNVTHNDNSRFHYTNWVYINVNGKEVGRWDFTSDKLPESKNFSREVKVKADGNLQIEAKANCNIHGSAGPATATVTVK